MSDWIKAAVNELCDDELHPADEIEEIIRRHAPFPSLLVYTDKLESVLRYIAELERDLSGARDHVGGLTAEVVVKKQQLADAQEAVTKISLAATKDLADRDRQIEGLAFILTHARAGLEHARKHAESIGQKQHWQWIIGELDAALASRRQETST